MTEPPWEPDPQVPVPQFIDRDALILTVRDVSADHHGNGWLSLSGSEAARIADAVIAFLSQPAPAPNAAWRDKQGDIWTEGEDGLMHTPETAPFSRAHVEKKWGPLILVSEPNFDACYNCHGAGYLDGGDMRDDEPCHACGGTGAEEAA